ncbi:Hybrid signal transduction protein dokA [Paramyrothecium foliicola]|nr:Hybrid signal transduction protein dokA [Paramyrothecium foliicola]
MSRMSEPQREREVQRYLQSWQVAQGSSLNVALNVDSIAAPDLRETGYKPHASSDKALTAFAQLAVLRLNVKRGMVSLIDASTQTILAEATRNLRLGDLDNATTGGNKDTVPNLDISQSPDVNDPSHKKTGSLENPTGDDLWLGASILSRPDAVCEHCLVDTCTGRDPDGRSFTTCGLIVPDCRLDPRFAQRSYVVSEPGVRFYAGVPIYARNGHKIGAYAVSDEKPRAGLTIDELKFMQDVARAVTEHLEWARDRVDRFKGERIVRGLAAFIEGCSTLSDESTWTKDEMPANPSVVRPPAMTVAARKRPPTRVPSRREAEPKSVIGSGLDDRPKTPPAPGPVSASTSPTSHRVEKTANQLKADSMSKMYQRAAEILRHSTLADGVVFFGAQASTARHSRSDRRGGFRLSDDDDPSLPNTSGSEGVGLDSSDSDASPSGRPCKILAFSLASEQARADIEQGTALSLGTLEKYFSLFPRGKTFSFTEQGAGVSSEDDSASDREPAANTETSGTESREGGRRRKARMDHKELLKKIPGAKSVVFLPLFDHAEDRLAGGCFLWTSITGRMMSLDDDLSYLRAFGNSIMSQVGRINTQKNEAAKTTFIASMSHELRSPLHGILGAAEFLKDTGTDAYQSTLINSIYTCGKTLLDTLNHVLDYSKINRLGRAQLRRGARQNKQIKLSSDSLESLNMTAVVDLSTLVEEVVDAIAAGHTFQKLPTPPFQERKDYNLPGFAPQPDPAAPSQPGQQPVSIFLDVCPSAARMVKTQPGALRRIVMNLFGNALKYTTSGHIVVSVRAQAISGKNKVDALIRVVDTGKGMSEEFQRNRLFVPFSQEDSFQPGTGLGLSIVKQIVDSLGGTLEVKSQQHKGTEVDVRLNLTLDPDQSPGASGDATMSIVERLKGMNVRLLDIEPTPELPNLAPQTAKLNEILKDTCSEWFGMQVTGGDDFNASEADILVYPRPPSIAPLRSTLEDVQKSGKTIPIIVLCPNAEEAIQFSQTRSKSVPNFSSMVEVIPQPCGPKKLAKVFHHCLNKKPGKPSSPVVNKLETALQQVGVEQDPRVPGSEVKSVESPPELDTTVVPLANGQTPFGQIPIATIASPPPLDPGTPSLRAADITSSAMKQEQSSGRKDVHVLLVDDNKINLQLLVMFIKKCGFSYAEAENGQEALDRFTHASLPAQEGGGSHAGKRGFDFILMDISMPVMNGIEATRRIRDLEKEHKLPSTNVIALTGLASADAQRDAKMAGVDIFMPKPVRFAELKKLLVAQPRP